MNAFGDESAVDPPTNVLPLDELPTTTIPTAPPRSAPPVNPPPMSPPPRSAPPMSPPLRSAPPVPEPPPIAARTAQPSAQPDRVDAALDASIELTKGLLGRAGSWLRESDHKLLVLTGAVACAFLILVALAG